MEILKSRASDNFQVQNHTVYMMPCQQKFNYSSTLAMFKKLGSRFVFCIFVFFMSSSRFRPSGLKQ